MTTSNPDAALNFGQEDHLDHDERYRRAREFDNVVTGLWDSFAEDAFVRDVDSGLYFNPDRMHTLDHKGEFLKVRGPLNILGPLRVGRSSCRPARPTRAVSSPPKPRKSFSPPEGRSPKETVLRRREVSHEEALPIPRAAQVLPGAFVVVGDTVDEAKKKKALLDSLVTPGQRPRVLVD